MNAEMYSRIGGKALPEDNLDTVKVINFVDEKGKPVALGQGDQGPAGPAGPKGPAATITKATHVDPGTGTVTEVVNALISAGLMESA
nr:MAG: hypothetical protein [Bacteriophage sp.]